MSVQWMTMFVDRPATGFDATQEFWRAVTGTTMSPTRGRHDEFASFVPTSGDVALKIQRTADESSASHLDLHVADPGALARRAEELGARRIDEFGEVVVLSSPGGYVWCAVPARFDGERTKTVGSRGRRAIVDQVCLDATTDRFDDECRFWSSLTGWPFERAIPEPFARLAVPADLPWRILLQRRDDPVAAPTHAHLDLACDDVEASIADHLALGADLVQRYPRWTVMRDPAGVTYCLTSRDPDTGASRRTS